MVHTISTDAIKLAEAEGKIEDVLAALEDLLHLPGIQGAKTRVENARTLVWEHMDEGAA